MIRLVRVILVVLLVVISSIISYYLGTQSEKVHVQVYEAVVTKHGYAVLYTFEGKEYSVAFRLRPWSYPAYRVDCWVIEGHHEEYADELLSQLDDEILVSGSEPSEYWINRKRWNKDIK